MAPTFSRLFSCEDASRGKVALSHRQHTTGDCPCQMRSPRLEELRLVNRTVTQERLISVPGLWLLGYGTKQVG